MLARQWFSRLIRRRHQNLSLRCAGESVRRSISTWLIDNDENVKVTQELMRHSHSKTTLDIHAKAVTPSKRRAHERIVDGLLAASDRNVGLVDQGEIAIVG